MTQGDDTVRDAYGHVAERYIDLFDTIDAVKDVDLALIERHLTACTGPVLDLGCGPGRLTDHLRTRGVDAIGIDVVPAFVHHARETYPDSRYGLGSIRNLAAPDRSVAGAVAWYSLIHTAPDDLDPMLDEIRRVLAEGAPFVVGFFDADELEAFDHKVARAWRWPADEFSARLAAAGFTEIERLRHPGTHQAGKRPHATIAAKTADA